MRSQFVIAVEDLRFATLLCGVCNTRVTLDLATEFAAPQSAFRCPRECPRCGKAFDSAIAPAVESMQAIYKTLVRLGDAVTFNGDTAAPPAKP
jgi:hypothetical protein